MSLTCVCCKLLEQIICRHILKHLENNRILTSLQHGFRSGHSCESQLIITKWGMCFNATKCYIMSIHRSRNPLTTHYTLSNHILEQVQENPYLGVIISENLKWSTYINKMHDIMKSFDSKKQTDLVILDFSKAFDTVPHKKLLRKLNNYGIDGKINKWIEHFLTQRQQRVIVEGDSSLSCSVESRVPQRTVLGSLLFLCHINDLPLCVRSQVRLFADDCLLYRSVKTQQDQQQLQTDLHSLERWATK